MCRSSDHSVGSVLLTKTNILRAIQDRQQQCDERSMAPAAERDRISRKRNLTEAEERGDERIGME
jgi:hypothetical protein